MIELQSSMSKHIPVSTRLLSTTAILLCCCVFVCACVLKNQSAPRWPSRFFWGKMNERNKRRTTTRHYRRPTTNFAFIFPSECTLVLNDNCPSIPGSRLLVVFNRRRLRTRRFALRPPGGGGSHGFFFPRKFPFGKMLCERYLLRRTVAHRTPCRWLSSPNALASMSW